MYFPPHDGFHSQTHLLPYTARCTAILFGLLRFCSASLSVSKPYYKVRIQSWMQMDYSPYCVNRNLSHALPNIFPSLNLQLYAFPNPRFNKCFMVILNIKLLDFSLIHRPLLCKKIHCITFCRMASPLYFSFSNILISVLACHFVPPSHFLTPSLSKIRLI